MTKIKCLQELFGANADPCDTRFGILTTGETTALREAIRALSEIEQYRQRLEDRDAEISELVAETKELRAALGRLRVVASPVYREDNADD